MVTMFLAAIAVLLLCVFGIGVLVIKRINFLVEKTLPAIEIENRKVLSAVSLLVESSPQFDSPVSRLTFQQSFNSDLFAQASESAALTGLSQLLAGYAADGLQMTLHGVRMTQQGAEMIVSASSSGQILFQKGLVKYQTHKATGMRLPQLVDAKTGKVFEKLKEMPVSTITSKLATISGAVVGAAHLIAGADLAKSMERVECKLDQLLALHRIDQLAKLERIYASARELSSKPMDSDRKLEMWRLRGELRELRSAWRQECSLKLSHIEDPANSAWLKRLFTSQRTTDRQLVGNISEGEAEVALINYSMRLEHVLAIGSNTTGEFMYSQTSELEQLDVLHRMLGEKSAYISGKYPELSIEPMDTALSRLIASCHKFLPQDNTLL